MPVALIAVAVVAAGADAYSTVEAKKGSDAAANLATQTAAYNAKVDQSQSNQIDLDAQANVQNMRKNAAVYMSRQQSAFAANGVNANSGSALAVRAATAGKFAQQEQNEWNKSQAREQSLASDAQAGVLEGDAQADMYHMQGAADVANGIGKVASIAGSAYAGGAFGGGAGSGGSALDNTPGLNNQQVDFTGASSTYGLA